MTHKRLRDYQEILLQRLQDEEFALMYLNEALKDENPQMFLLALKNIVEAQGYDITILAKDTKLSRMSLYRILSEKGNPRWDNLTSLFKALGLSIQIAKTEEKPAIETFSLDKKLYKVLTKQASKQGITVNDLIHEKLRK